ncbi:MAG: ABC transporter substrate-binding protein [Rhodospirillaceae bacterium]
MKTFLKSVALAASMVLGATSIAQADTIRVATEGAFPPFNFIDDNGNPGGFDVDIAMALCAEMKADCELVTQDWDGIIPALLAKKYDVIIASMSITEERKKSVLFSDPYYNNQFHFVGPKDTEIDTSAAGLDGKTIGAQRATVSAGWIEENLGDAVTVNLYDTTEEAFLDLNSGRVDLVLNDTLPTLDWLKSDAGAGFALVGDSVIDDDVVGMAFRLEDTELAGKFNAALKAIVANGTYGEINEKYFPGLKLLDY